MSGRPLERGDVCEVIGGMGMAKSPNIGLRVTVTHRMFGAMGADHSRLGPMYNCVGDGVVQLGDGGNYVIKGWADFPDIWLRRLPPDELPAPAQRAARNVTA